MIWKAKIQFLGGLIHLFQFGYLFSPNCCKYIHNFVEITEDGDKSYFDPSFTIECRVARPLALCEKNTLRCIVSYRAYCTIPDDIVNIIDLWEVRYRKYLIGGKCGKISGGKVVDSFLEFYCGIGYLL